MPVITFRIFAASVLLFMLWLAVVPWFYLPPILSIGCDLLVAACFALIVNLGAVARGDLP